MDVPLLNATFLLVFLFLRNNFTGIDAIAYVFEDFFCKFYGRIRVKRSESSSSSEQSLSLIPLSFSSSHSSFVFDLKFYSSSIADSTSFETGGVALSRRDSDFISSEGGVDFD